MLFGINEIDFNEKDMITEDSIYRFFKAIIAGDTISEDVWRCAYRRGILNIVDTVERPEEASRWNYPVDTIFKLDGKYFRFTYYEGLTECQDNKFITMSAEQVHKASRTIIVEEWESDNDN